MPLEWGWRAVGLCFSCLFLVHPPGLTRLVVERVGWWVGCKPWYVYPRETPPHTRTARAQPPAARRRRHSRPHHHRHGERSPTARQLRSNGLCSPPKRGLDLGSALRLLFLSRAASSRLTSDLPMKPGRTRN